MAGKSKKTKLKLLYIKDYLYKYSDENNPVSADELSDMLLEKEIECERKSIYSDVQALRDYGSDIFRVRAPKNGYYIGERTFELPEIRLMADAVQAAKFITPKKSKELITKISTLCSVGQAEDISNQVYIDSSVKCTNEDIYYNIDDINTAIKNKKKISFIYKRRKVNEKADGIVSSQKTLTMSPYAMIWSDDHYYLVGNNSKYDNLMHVRIDRMKNVKILDENIRSFTEVSDYKNAFDAADYSSKLFNMFSGEIQEMELYCENSIIEEILDRFGSAAKVRRTVNEEHFKVLVKAVVSEGLASWVMQYGNMIEIKSPLILRNMVKDKAEEIAALYKNDIFKA